jgi:Tfp pilus assembly protein PilF
VIGLARRLSSRSSFWLVAGAVALLVAKWSVVAAATKCPEAFDFTELAGGSFACLLKWKPDAQSAPQRSKEAARSSHNASLAATNCPEGFEFTKLTGGSFACILKWSSPELAAHQESKDRGHSPRTIVEQTIVAFAKDHNVAKARTGYEAALKLDPAYVPAQFGLAVMLEAQNDWNHARAMFQNVVSNPRAGPLITPARQEITRIDVAAAVADSPERRKGHQYDLLISQARMLLSGGVPAAAAERVEAARSIDDSRWQAYALAAEIAQATQRSTEATRLFDAAARRANGTTRANLQKAAAREATNAMSRRFRLGMSPAEVNAALNWPFTSVAWKDLPVAGEYKTSEVRYFWRKLDEVSDLPFSEFYAPCSRGDNSLVFLFDQSGGLFRISLRLWGSCSHEQIVQSLAKTLGTSWTEGGSFRWFRDEGATAILAGVSSNTISSLEWTTKNAPRHEGQPW